MVGASGLLSARIRAHVRVVCVPGGGRGEGGGRVAVWRVCEVKNLIKKPVVCPVWLRGDGTLLRSLPASRSVPTATR